MNSPPTHTHRWSSIMNSTLGPGLRFPHWGNIGIHAPNSATAVWPQASHSPFLSLSWNRGPLKFPFSSKNERVYEHFHMQITINYFFLEHVPHFPFPIHISKIRLLIAFGFESSLKSSPVLGAKKDLTGYWETDMCSWVGPSPLIALPPFPLYFSVLPVVCMSGELSSSALCYIVSKREVGLKRPQWKAQRWLSLLVSSDLWRAPAQTKGGKESLLFMLSFNGSMNILKSQFKYDIRTESLLLFKPWLEHGVLASVVEQVK